MDSRFSIQGLNPFYKSSQVKMPVSKHAVDYNMNHTNRGIAIIFNNKNFEERLNLRERRGTNRDRDNFKNALLRIGFREKDILIHNDCTAKMVKTEVDRVADLDHTDNDCLVIAIFSHGDRGILYGTDKKFKPDQLWEPFLANKCHSLAGKPKLFFIQACQDDRVDHGVPNLDVADGRETNCKIPTFADILISYSSVPGFYSWRHTENGSWYIQALCNIFMLYGHDFDLVTMLTVVIQRVGLDFESTTPHCMNKERQVPCTSSMLMRDVFSPKKPIPISLGTG